MVVPTGGRVWGIERFKFEDRRFNQIMVDHNI
jgi:hypothetical protein